jgi:hypothetical protein
MFLKEILMWKNTLILFLFPLALSAQSDVSSLSSILEYTAEADDYNGNILVAQNGKVVYRGSFGVSRINEDIPLDSATHASRLMPPTLS